MQHGGDEVKFGFDGADKEVFFIAFDGICNEVSATCWSDRIAGVIYFKDRETAETAITEVVEPFLAKNPGFDWRKM